MKTITLQDRELISSLIGEGLTSLAEGVIEKDLLLTEVLGIVAKSANEIIQPVFCGGTCLSKAHGLIERMSEDIDFKLVAPTDLSRTARSKTLSAFKMHLATEFRNAGFDVPAEQIKARDENSYILMNLHYESRFAPVVSLRPEIMVELNARPPVLPTRNLPIQPMLSQLTQRPGTSVDIRCISVEETLAEKVLSFLRRTAEVRAGRNRAAYDDRLVRHIYDVYAIVDKHEALDLPHEHFAVLVAGDADQYRNQYPEFKTDPGGQMREVLAALSDQPALFENDYLNFVDELVFGKPVGFNQACAVFINVAEQMISRFESGQA